MADFDSSLPVRTENPGDVISKIADATTPSQQLTVNPDGSINITDNGGVITVDATDFDIRDLTSASDSVEVLQDTHDDLNANANIQVGNADVANGNPVPVSDAGGSLTVDAVNLDIRDLVFATDKVDVTGSDITATVTATDLDIRDLDSAQDSVEVLQATHDNLNANANIQVGDADVANGNPVPVSDAGGSLTVDATDLDIRDLDAAQDNVAISDGTDTLAVNTDGSINVVIQEDVGTEVVNYDTQASLAGGATDNHDLVFASASKLYQILASASGKLKITVQIETGSATNTFNTIAVGFNSTATPNIDINLAKYAAIPAGARVRVIRQNNDNQAQDVYSTIVGILG